MPESISLYGGTQGRRVTVHDIASAKERGERWPMLTAYDATIAGIFDQAGIPVLLVGDSAGNVVLGYDSTLPIRVSDIVTMTAAVVRGTSRALVVADMPFGSYQSSPEQALDTAVRLVKDGGAHAVKLEGGERVRRQVEVIVAAGIPVMAHLGLTRRASTPSAATGCKAAARLESSCWPTPRRCRPQARLPWCSRWSRPT